ncbi:MAG TPA: hypothetical protein VKH37_12455 [Ferruginibacter sp.]|nr:hypothetical protein [Ferruginibacter sp.]
MNHDALPIVRSRVLVVKQRCYEPSTMNYGALPIVRSRVLVVKSAAMNHQL